MSRPITAHLDRGGEEEEQQVLQGEAGHHAAVIGHVVVRPTNTEIMLVTLYARTGGIITFTN